MFASIISEVVQRKCTLNQEKNPFIGCAFKSSFLLSLTVFSDPFKQRTPKRNVYMGMGWADTPVMFSRGRSFGIPAGVRRLLGDMAVEGKITCKKRKTVLRGHYLNVEN